MTSSLRGNLIALALLGLAVLAAFALGRYPVGPGDIAGSLWSALTGQPSGLPPQVETVIWSIREAALDVPTGQNLPILFTLREPLPWQVAAVPRRRGAFRAAICWPCQRPGAIG